MEPNARFRSNVRTFYAWIGSMVILVVAPLVALRLSDQETTLARVTAVVLGVGGMLPWMWVVVSIIRRGDEFVRRLHLVAFGLAFGGAIFLIVTLEWLIRAHFIDPPDMKMLLLGCIVVWAIALVAARRYFERAR
jgi:hypothetical protein